uniref:RIN4 pathogenic type III effector avirulence factor Avr cleavage site domain-containing protein n=1 Tax=Leersia perrieri TaxID=77586 RepID=A0A0D9XTX4_9ORYZ
MANRKEQGDQQRRRTTVPAFGEWDEMKAAGVMPDYSLDFSKIRALRMQQRNDHGPLAAAAAGEVETAGRRSSSAADVDADSDRRRRRHHHHHRRQHSDGTDLRRPLRHDRAAPKERSKLSYLFCCIAG